MKNYNVYCALHIGTRTGDIWTTEKFDSRLIKIKNTSTQKIIVVSNRKIDNNYIKLHKATTGIDITAIENAIVIEEYYRDLLQIKIEENKTATLEISAAKNCLTSLKYLHQHPNDSIRITYWLTIIICVPTLIDWVIRVLQWLCKL